MDCRSEYGSVLLPKSAQDLLLNMSVGNGDMSIPSVYHYLPHLIGKPSSLKPALKLSKGRAGGKCVSDELLLQFAFSSMRGRQQLSCPVLRPPSGPNARPQDNMHLT